MKKITTLSLLLLLTTVGQLLAQTLYEDAKQIAKYVDNSQAFDFSLAPTRQDNDMNLEIKRLQALTATPALDTLIKRRQRARLAKRDSVLSLLIKYKIITAAEAADLDSLNKAMHKNPFMENFIFAGSTQAAAGAPNLKSLVKSGISSLGSLDVTNIAEGISQFMISRAKEELTIAFFDRFKKCVEANPEIQVMFPKTTIALENLLDYHYPEMLPTLQKAFFDDLSLLPIHLDDVLELPRYRDLLENFPEVRIAVHTLRIVGELDSEHPYSIIHEIASLKEWEDPKASVSLRNMGNSIRVGDIFSLSLAKDSAYQATHTSPWISTKEMKDLIQNEVLFKVYLALIFQQVEHVELVYPNLASGSITFTTRSGNISFGQLMRQNKNNLALFQSKVSELILLAEKLKVTIDDIKKNPNKTPDDYHTYIGQGIDVIEYCFEVVRIFDERFVTADYVKTVRSGNDLYLNIAKKQYSAAITNAVDILNEIQIIVRESRGDIRNAAITAVTSPTTTLSKSTSEIVSKAKANEEITTKDLKKLNSDASFTSTLTPDQRTAIFDTKSEDSLALLENVIPDISKYGLFIANIASAETPAEVEQIIEAAVLPVGSSSIKKNSEWNLAVQSYLGAYYLTSNRTTDVERAWSDKFGVIAPIGIGMSYGLRKGGSFTLFASLLDLGAIVDYKLKYDSVPKTPSSSADVKTSKSYEVKLGQIFSPGGYLIYGLPWNLPLSLGFGAQYGPGLSSIDESGNTVVDNPYWRWNAFLAVDIPLFNIYNKERRFEKRRK